MPRIHSIMSGDGTICLVIDGRHYTVGVSHPCYKNIRHSVLKRPIDEGTIIGLLDIPGFISSISQGKVRVSLDEGKVWYNDTEFHDKAFCERILRLMSEGQDIDYLINFLNNLGQNPEFRAIMETFKFICNKGMPITTDGCFLAYKGVRGDYYDKWTGTILNKPDGRRVEESRELINNNPSSSCGKGLHCGSIEYGRNWGAGGHCVLVKVNPRDVVCVPNHDCEKMRVCGYWVVKDFDSALDEGVSLQGEVYDSTGERVNSSMFTDMEVKGQFDNDVAVHWNEEEGRTYSKGLEAGRYDHDDDDEYDDEYEEKYCEDCDELMEDCTCDDMCDICGDYKFECVCGNQG